VPPAPATKLVCSPGLALILFGILKAEAHGEVFVVMNIENSQAKIQ